MGLMSLIARKFNPEKHQPQLRAPPYESKISAKSPVRLVQTVSYSGDAIRDSSKATGHPLKNAWAQAVPSLEKVRESSFDSESEDEAPSPVVRGFRGDDVPSRLSTRPTTSSRPGSRLSLPVAPRARVGFVAKSEPGTPTTLHSHTYSHRAQSSISSSRFTSSIRNFSTGKAHIDLLDAQSEFKPLDFHGRVKASGARDYGEDVADRNIVANSSSTSQAAALAADQNKKNAAHRQTLQFVPPTTMAESYSTPTLAELHSIHDQQELADKKNRRRSLQISVNDANRIVSSWGATSPASDSGFRHTTQSENRRHASSDGLRRGLSTSSKKGGAFPSIFEDGHDVVQYAVSNQPILSPQPTSFHLSASLASSALTASNRRPSTMHSMNTTPSAKPPQQQAQPTLEFHTGMPDLSNLPNHLTERALTFKHEWHDDATDRESAPSPYIRTNRSRSHSGDSVFLQEQSRVERTATPQRRSSQATESEEPTPGLTNSTRNWSLSSSTPTTSSSSSSSAMYGRPQSRNTTSTSIDLSTMGLLNASLVSLNGDIVMGQLPLKDLVKGPSLLPSSEPFNIDDYVSDDNDSFINGQLGRAGNEEDLLFNSGYGMNGIQLPGLEDSFSVSASAPSISVRDSRRSKAVPRSAPTDIETCLDLDDLASVNDIMLACPIIGDDDNDDDDDLLSPRLDISRHRRSSGPLDYFDHMLSPNRAQTPTRTHSPAGSASSRRSETKRLTAIFGPTSSPSSCSGNTGSALGRNSLRFHPHPSHQLLALGNNVGEQVIEEERYDDKVDTATAVELCKESRSRATQKRASMLSITKPASGRGMVKTISIEGRQRSGSTGVDASMAKRGIPNIMDVPELTEDVGGQADSE